MKTNPEVDAWFKTYENPMKDIVMAIREEVLGTDDRIEETMKWQAPTFMYKGNIASFFPKAKKHASLMFHRGTHLPDPKKLLEGTGNESRVLKVFDMADLKKKRTVLRSYIKAWIKMQDEK